MTLSGYHVHGDTLRTLLSNSSTVLTYSSLHYHGPVSCPLWNIKWLKGVFAILDYSSSVSLRLVASPGSMELLTAQHVT